MSEENLPEKINRTIDRAVEEASERYARMTPLRAVIASIPYLGGGLDVIFMAEGERAFKRRIQMLLHNMKERMESVEEEAVSKDYVESEEFIDLVLKAFDSATKTRDEEKIRWYARILTESTLKAKREGYTPEEYLYLTADLSPKELRIARVLYDLQSLRLVQTGKDFAPEMDAWEGDSKKLCAEFNLQYDELVFFLKRIEAVGLVRSIGRMSMGNEGIVPETYEITPSFRKMMTFLAFSR